MPEARQRFLRRTWVRRAVPAAAVTVLVVAGTAVVRTNANATPVDTYRTTTVSTGSVEQRLHLTGSVQRVNQVSQGFAVDGTVASVLVYVGDTVKAGQALATLDPGPLRSAVTDAQATLAQAKATLESDQSAATTATAATAVAPTRTSTPTTPPRAPGPSGRSGTDQSLAQAQELVTSGQRTVAADLGRASVALAQCAPFFPSAPSPSTPSPSTPSPSTPSPSTPSPTPSPTSPTTTPTSTTTTPTSTTTTPTSTTTTATSTTTTATSTTATAPSDAQITACVGALKTAPTQQQIQQDQQALTRSQADLTKAVTLAITTAGNTAKASGSASQSAISQSAISQSASARTGATSQSSVARVVSDQAAVTSAETALSSAQADLASSTLKSSIAGTVGSVSLAKNASSNGNSIVIVGAGAVEITVNVPLASMANVHVGQKANVTPQGATGSVPGAVTSISLLPSASTSTSRTASGTGTRTAQAAGTASSPTYPVVVLVPDALPALASGARAEVSLLVGNATDVLTVPNSALTPLGNGQALAMTFKDGVATRALVKTGYAGTLTTQVTSGLTAGQQVVLADLNTALPTNTTNARRFGVGGAAGGPGGAGPGGAGPGGAGFRGTPGGLGGGTITGRTGFTPGG
ncbi:MAG: efflux RND transporter periplasmic adaptor subunit [Dermatophilaceae bacterium]